MTAKLLGSARAATRTLAAAPAARKDMLVSTDWLAQHVNDANVVVLHVSANRTAYDAGHIPGARFVGLPEIAITRNGVPNELPDVPVLKKVFEGVGVSDNSRVILYGDASVLPATRAYFTLDYLGHGDQAALLDGGLDKWRAEGRMLSKDAPTVAQGNLTPRLKPEIVMQIDTVKEVAAKPQASGPLLVDARPATDYSGEKGSHIPTAVNQNWMDGQVS